MAIRRRDLLAGSAAALGGAAVARLGRGEALVSDVAADVAADLAADSPPPAPATQKATSRARPNVLMVAVDDLKPWIGPHGFSAAHTPALDKLSQTGVVFRRAYCAAPACSPSRAAVFTGLAPHETGVYLNRHNWRERVPNVVSLPRLLREAGYATAGFGKLFHAVSHDDPAAWTERQHHKLLRLPGAPLAGMGARWRKSGSRFDWAALDTPVEDMDDHKQVDRAVEFMSRDHGQPWFVACGIFRPHLPWYVPRQFFDLHPLDSVPLPVVPADDLRDVPARGRTFARQDEHRYIVSRGLWKRAVQAYLASISYADFEVGRLLAKTPPNTVVVLWSDHGWHLGPKNHWHKYALWEEASQTVFAISGPGFAAGRQCGRTVSLLDIYPTLCELCDARPPHPLSGRSVVPLAVNPDAAWNRPALTTYGPNNHSIRSERYRYIRYDDGAEELYDHESDPHEWTNLAGSVSSLLVRHAHAALLPAPVKRGTGKPVRLRKRTWLESSGRRALVPS